MGKPDCEYKRDYISSTLVVSMGNGLEVLDQSTGKKHRTHSLLVPANSNITINTLDAPISFCKLDDYGMDLAALKKTAKNSLSTTGNVDLYSGIRHESEIVRDIDTLWTMRATASDAFENLETWLDFLKSPSSEAPDPRIVKIVLAIQNNKKENTSVAELGKSVNLSVTQLSFIFKKVTGTNIRKFRLWQRVLWSAVKVSQGLSLQNTAIDIGFSDYSHFSRTFKQLSGGNASSAKSSTEIRVLAT